MPNPIAPSSKPTNPPVLTLLLSPRQRIGIVSTYPPKLCGLGTFAAALEAALVDAGHRVDIVRVEDGVVPLATRAAVAAEIRPNDPASIRHATIALSKCDAVIVQHEFGIYGGKDGEEVLALLDSLRCPSIVTVHTVLSEPSVHQREILEAVVRRSTHSVVMSDIARFRLGAHYNVDLRKVSVIPHGASADSPTLGCASVQKPASTMSHLHPAGRSGTRSGPKPFRPLSPTASPELLTWGLIGPGKGIEHVIDALGMLRDTRPPIRYTVSGVTHPNVLASAGDTYRDALVERAHAQGIASSVTFDASYRDVGALMRYVATASLVVLPYDSREQVTSGVLVDAIAAGVPVVATEFPHAIEVLSSGAGMIVPHGDPAALAEAINAVLSDPPLRAAMAAEARRIAPSFGWDAVAQQYADLVDLVERVEHPVAI